MKFWKMLVLVAIASFAVGFIYTDVFAAQQEYTYTFTRYWPSGTVSSYTLTGPFPCDSTAHPPDIRFYYWDGPNHAIINTMDVPPNQLVVHSGTTDVIGSDGNVLYQASKLITSTIEALGNATATVIEGIGTAIGTILDHLHLDFGIEAGFTREGAQIKFKAKALGDTPTQDDIAAGLTNQYQEIMMYDCDMVYDSSTDNYNVEIYNNQTHDSVNSIVISGDDVTNNNNQIGIDIAGSLIPQHPGIYQLTVTGGSYSGGSYSSESTFTAGEQLTQIVYIIEAAESSSYVRITNLSEGQQFDYIPSINIDNQSDDLSYVYVNDVNVYTLNGKGQVSISSDKTGFRLGMNAISIKSKDYTVLESLNIQINATDGLPPIEPPVEGETGLLNMILGFFKGVANIFSVVINGIGSLISSVGEMPKVMGTFMSGMPSGLSALMVTGMAAFILIAIYNAVRGR